MIQVIRHGGFDSKHIVGKMHNELTDVVFLNSCDFIQPHFLIREVLRFFSVRKGKDSLVELLLQHSVVADLLYKEYEGEWKPGAENVWHVARTDSNYIHSPIAKSALIDACVSVMLEIQKRMPLRLIIGDITSLDTNSLDLLKQLFHLHSSHCPDLIICYSEQWPDDVYDEETGISRFFGYETVTVPQAFVYAFEAMADSCTFAETADLLQFPMNRDEVCFTYNQESTAESEAFNMLASGYDYTQEQATQLFGAVCKCFRLFDFSNALFMGLSLRNKVFEKLNTAQRAELLHIIGLSAHIRHFYTQGNQRLSVFLRNVFDEALYYETRLPNRIALYYRLAVTTARRMNDLTAARNYISKAESEFPVDFEDWFLLARAWHMNIHSFVLMKEGRLADAVAKHEEGYFSLQKISANSATVYDRELAFTKAVLAENLATLSAQQHNYEAMRKWFEIETAFSSNWPFFHASAKSEWQSLYFQQHQLDQADKLGKEGFELSRRSFNYVLEYYFSLSLAEISFRKGVAEKAAGYYVRCLQYNQKIGHSYPAITRLYLLHAAVGMYLKAGDFEQAKYWLNETDRSAGFSAAISTLFLEAELAALQNSIAESNTLVNEAIELAAEEGSSDAFFTALLSAGRLALLSGRRSEALTAFTQAGELPGLAIGGLPFKPPWHQRASLHIGLAQTLSNPHSHLPEAIRSLVAALPTTTPAWQMIPDVISLIAELPATELEALKAQTGDAFDTLLTAAGQRNDCQAALQSIHSITISKKSFK